MGASYSVYTFHDRVAIYKLKGLSEDQAYLRAYSKTSFFSRDKIEGEYHYAKFMEAYRKDKVTVKLSMKLLKHPHRLYQTITLLHPQVKKLRYLFLVADIDNIEEYDVNLFDNSTILKMYLLIPEKIGNVIKLLPAEVKTYEFFLPVLGILNNRGLLSKPSEDARRGYLSRYRGNGDNIILRKGKTSMLTNESDPLYYG
jgi:hypothetical protein